ncbi:MAG TPA: DUF2085 domain-containing protein [Anaerolineae bacterium]|nr:DUF2085 domain-containing protein [Anaerolineae bacterium]
MSYWLIQHWLLVFNLMIGLWIFLPWLAPILMHLGWERAGQAIYLLYAPQCHQMPQRSFFIFGVSPMYSLNEIQTVWQQTDNPLILRQFVGNVDMGWKVAWSDRMVYMYTAIFIFGGGYGLVRKWFKPISIWSFVLLLLPMAIDGGTHMISDIMGGIGGGFRDYNVWLATLTNHTFAPNFYAGDMLGSFNAWMRLFTGICFGLGIVGFVYPRLDEGVSIAAREIENKVKKAGKPL